MEVWRNLSIFPYQQVSDHGNVRSFFIAAHGQIVDEPYEIPIKENLDGSLYVVVDRDCYPCKRRLDQLVAETFVERHGYDYCIRHIDGDIKNCRADNLEWYTPRLEPSDIPVLATQVISLEKTWFRNQAEASRVLKVPASNISRILHDRAYEANGYHFEWVEALNPDRKWRHGDIKATNIDTGEELIFESQVMAAKHLGVHQAHISACLNGRLKKTGRWIFEYAKK